ncbi:hypothetical protein FACS1894125_1030 [Actinomycetota bacterium]|nr:hypothetical protein FACS1894125_1030 [Actinomycetota bacterium]
MGVGQLDGVDSVQVNFATKTAVVAGAVSNEAVEKAVKDAGYSATFASDSEELNSLDDEEGEPQSGGTNSKKNRLKHGEDIIWRNKFVVGAVLSIPFLYFMFEMFIMPTSDMSSVMYRIEVFAQLLLATIAQFYLGAVFYKGALGALRNKMANMDVLVALGTTVAYLYSVYNFFLTDDGHLYFETGVFLLTFVCLGKWLETRATSQASSAIKALMKLRPTRKVALGEVVDLKPGDVIPADGVIVKSKGQIDESMMTGESELVVRESGNECKVYQGTILMQGLISVEVLKIGDDTMLSKIIQLVEDAQLNKAPIQSLADTISGKFVPAVVVLSALSGLVWYFLAAPGDFDRALMVFASVVVIACPCALGLATPTAIMVGTGLGSKIGVLIKGGAPLQSLASIKDVVFDKTGTLTTGIVELDKDGNRTQNVVGDELRAGAKEAIEGLQKMGISVHLLSGDKRKKALAVSAKAGILPEHTISDVLPDGKAEQIEKLLETQRSVAMVGDGINDAPALAVATVGIAMGDGTDVALEAGDVALMRSDPRDVVKAVRLSRATMLKIKQNLALSLGYNVLMIPIAAGVLAPLGIMLSPAIAGACMALSSVSVVTNSLLLGQKKF